MKAPPLLLPASHNSRVREQGDLVGGQAKPCVRLIQLLGPDKPQAIGVTCSSPSARFPASAKYAHRCAGGGRPSRERPDALCAYSPSEMQMACMSHPASTMVRMLGAKNMASSSGCAVSTTARGFESLPASAASCVSLLVRVVHCRRAAKSRTIRARPGLKPPPDLVSGSGFILRCGLSSSAAMPTSSGCSSTSGSWRDEDGGDAGTRRRSIEMCSVRVMADDGQFWNKQGSAKGGVRTKEFWAGAWLPSDVHVPWWPNESPGLAKQRGSTTTGPCRRTCTCKAGRGTKHSP